MPSETQMTDSEARLVLPTSFANSTVIAEQVSATEVRVRMANVNDEEEFSFIEAVKGPLSDRDRDRFLALLAEPPAQTFVAVEVGIASDWLQHSRRRISRFRAFSG